jgi:hypothetical protein
MRQRAIRIDWVAGLILFQVSGKLGVEKGRTEFHNQSNKINFLLGYI